MNSNVPETVTALVADLETRTKSTSTSSSRTSTGFFSIILLLLQCRKGMKTFPTKEPKSSSSSRVEINEADALVPQIPQLEMWYGLRKVQALQDHLGSDEEEEGVSGGGGVDGDKQTRHFDFWDGGLMNVHFEQAQSSIDRDMRGQKARVFFQALGSDHRQSKVWWNRAIFNLFIKRKEICVSVTVL